MSTKNSINLEAGNNITLTETSGNLVIASTVPSGRLTWNYIDSTGTRELSPNNGYFVAVNTSGSWHFTLPSASMNFGDIVQIMVYPVVTDISVNVYPNVSSNKLVFEGTIIEGSSSNYLSIGPAGGSITLTCGGNNTGSNSYIVTSAVGNISTH